MMHYDTLPRSHRILPRETWSPERYERPTSYATLPAGLHGDWETVQPSAQRVHLGESRSNTRSLGISERFSDLDLYDDFENHKKMGRMYLNNENFDYPSRRPEKLENDYLDYSRNRFHSSNPSQRRNVVPERRERYIPIPIQHVKTVPKTKTKFDMNRNKSNFVESERGFSTPRHNMVWRQNSGELIEISDDTDNEESLSDGDSDCDIYPFILRNLNNNTKRGKKKSSGRAEPYCLRKSSSPEKDNSAVSASHYTNDRTIPYGLRHSSSPSVDRSLLSHSNNRRSQPSTSHSTSHRERDIFDEERDVACVSNDNYRYRKMAEKLQTAPPYSRLPDHSENSFRYPQGSSYLNGKLHSQSVVGQKQYDKQSYSKYEDKYDLIENDKDSAFSKNGYQFSDEENGVISLDDFKYDKAGTSRKETVDSRKSSDSDNADGGIVQTPSYPAYNIIRDMIKPEERQVDYIRGDGNCLFRALSKVIYNTESCHEEIRQAVVDLMEKYPKDFEQFIDEKSLHLHIISMRKDGTWGTQAEIYGAATLLQRDIYILSPDPSGKQYRWLLFSPRFEIIDVDSFDSCYITLCHTNGNHYDRIAPLIGKCNCHLMSPELAGVKENVDLTKESDDFENDLSSVIV